MRQYTRVTWQPKKNRQWPDYAMAIGCMLFIVVIFVYVLVQVVGWFAKVVRFG